MSNRIKRRTGGDRQQANLALQLFEQWAKPFRFWMKVLNDQARVQHMSNATSIQLNTLKSSFVENAKQLIDPMAKMNIDAQPLLSFIRHDDGTDATLIGVEHALRQLIGKLETDAAPASPSQTSDILEAAVAKMAEDLGSNPEKLRILTILSNCRDLSARKAAVRAGTSKSKVQRLREKYPNRLGATNSRQKKHDREQSLRKKGQSYER